MDQMAKVYRNIPSYKGVKILKIRKGSIIVDHEVILNIKNEKTPAVEYEEALNQVEKALDNAIKCDTETTDQENCPNFAITNVTVSNDTNTFNDSAVCNTLIPEDFRQYFTAYTNNSGISCISQCDARHKERKTCNLGICQVTRAGPTCFCHHTDSLWYLGSDCSGPISKDGVFGAIGVLAVALLGITVGLATYLVWKRKQMKRERDIRDDLVNQWMEDEIEWPSADSQRRAGADNVAGVPYDDVYEENTHRNTRAKRSTSLGSDQSSANSAGCSSPYQMAPAGLQSRHPGWLNQYFISLENEQIPVRISRPQIRRSSDSC
nr:PREDICTED: mucin-17-like [Lepisosteus oculatus]